MATAEALLASSSPRRAPQPPAVDRADEAEQALEQPTGIRAERRIDPMLPTLPTYEVGAAFGVELVSR